MPFLASLLSFHILSLLRPSSPSFSLPSLYNSLSIQRTISLKETPHIYLPYPTIVFLFPSSHSPLLLSFE